MITCNQLLFSIIIVICNRGFFITSNRNVSNYIAKWPVIMITL